MPLSPPSSGVLNSNEVLQQCEVFTVKQSLMCKLEHLFLKFSRTEDDLQFWVLYKFLCSSSSLICNIALCSVGEDLLSCTAVWFGVCVVHSFTIAQTQSERERERE